MRATASRPEKWPRPRSYPAEGRAAVLVAAFWGESAERALAALSRAARPRAFPDGIPPRVGEVAHYVDRVFETLARLVRGLPNRKPVAKKETLQDDPAKNLRDFKVSLDRGIAYVAARRRAQPAAAG